VVMEMVKRNEENEGEEEEFSKKSEGKREKERGRSERLGLNLWDPRSVQIPRLRIESLNTVTGVTKADGQGVKPNDGRHEG